MKKLTMFTIISRTVDQKNKHFDQNKGRFKVLNNSPFMNNHVEK